MSINPIYNKIIKTGTDLIKDSRLFLFPKISVILSIECIRHKIFQYVLPCYVNTIYVNTFNARSQMSVSKHNLTRETWFISFLLSFLTKKSEHEVKLN